MKSIGFAIRFLLFALCTPLLAMIMIFVFVANPELLFFQKRRGEAADVWRKSWRWVRGEQC